jgi:hypothetical protein
MNRVDFFASELHYLVHLLPIWKALPDDAKGTVFMAGAAADQAGNAGLPRVQMAHPPPAHTPIMVASFKDSQHLGARPIVYVEHGVGQTYVDRPAAESYPGGIGHDRVVLFVCPSDRVAGLWAKRYPDTPTVVVGSPKMDALHARRAALGDRWRPAHPQPTVVWSFHSDVRLVPETMSAFPHYEDALPALVARLNHDGIRVVGHAHPRSYFKLRRRWDQVGVESIWSFESAVAQADCYLVDNSSTLYEAASLGVPTIALNAPWYRRDVDHGLRFWDTLPGDMIDGPDDVVTAISRALDDPDSLRDARERAVRAVYADTDGYAAQRAAQAIVRVLGGPDEGG